ncbi:MAG TPA: 50S ribosomal protein L11 methyltransferase [Geobacteraceae bacterium]
MSTPWAEVTCTVPTAMVDDLAAFLVELSGCGVSIENLTVDTFSVETIEETPTKAVKAYLANNALLEANLARITAWLHDNGHRYAGFVSQQPAVVLLQEEDWANGWKQHFHPTRVGKRLVIKPTWEDYTALPDDILIELDPGLAFGTGTHPTTRMCLEALEGIVFRDPPFDVSSRFLPTTILDVGTGSGILAIAGAKFGIREIVAIDIDPRAVEVTHGNLELNRIAEPVTINVSTTPIEAVAGTYHIVLANILAEELVRLADHLISRVAPNGFLILSGILTEREEFVRNGFAPYPLTLAAALRESEWSCLCYQSRP